MVRLEPLPSTRACVRVSASVGFHTPASPNKYFQAVTFLGFFPERIHPCDTPPGG